MFKRSKRLTKADFSSGALGRGRRFASPHFSALSSTATKGYAVVISKKTIKSSVKRHLMKRRILAVLTKLTLPGSLVVYPKAAALELSPIALKTELTELVSRF